MIRLLLVDDHEIVRRGLRELLEVEEDLRVVAEAGSLNEALELDLAEVDVAVLDVRLPDGSGVDLCRVIREKRPELACLMLTSFADNDALNASVLAGARGYVLKNVRGDELVKSIRRVADGEMLLTNDQIERARERGGVEIVCGEAVHRPRQTNDGRGDIAPQRGADDEA